MVLVMVIMVVLMMAMLPMMPAPAIVVVIVVVTACPRLAAAKAAPHRHQDNQFSEQRAPPSIVTARI